MCIKLFDFTLKGIKNLWTERELFKNPIYYRALHVEQIQEGLKKTTPFILVLLLLLSAVFFYVLLKYHMQSKQLRLLSEQIDSFLDGKTEEMVLMLSADSHIQEILVKLNRLIENQILLENRQKKQEENNRHMLANISHDLKTPLTVIYGYSEMLKESLNLKEEDKRKIDKIHKKTKDVLDMVEEFFDLAKLESGEMRFDIQKINLCEICRNEILQYYEFLENSRWHVKLEIPESDIWFLGDKRAIQRMLSNLIQNVIRYGADGKYLGIQIKEAGQEILLKIEDRGKGIVEDSQEKIFERLVTLEDSRNKKYQGSGLGLTITKRLTEAMGGKIQVQSKPYVRTIFTVLLPQNCK